MRPILYPLFLILGTMMTATVVHAFVVVPRTSSSSSTQQAVAFVVVTPPKNLPCWRRNAHSADAEAEADDNTDDDAAAAAVVAVDSDDKYMEPPIECFVIDTDDEEEVIPHVVCTSEPDEYAWFNGIDRDAMKPATDKDSELTTECVEGASPRGIPEWECKPSK